MHIFNVKLPFYPPSEVKYGLQNRVPTRSEKEGCRDRPHTQMQSFRDVLDECGFMDLSFVGFPFTWHKHYTGYTMWERLDRVMATNEWFSMFPSTQIHHLDVTNFDHKALWITPEGRGVHELGQVEFVPDPDSTRNFWVGEKGTRN